MIVIAGKNNIAVYGLKKLLSFVDRGTIAVIPNRNDVGCNNWQRSLLFFAKKWGVQTISLAEAEAKADLFISLEFDTIVKPTAFKTKRLYNIHFSLLPKYKGMYTSVWPILNGEKISGASLHVINKGIDTGPILAQQSFTIPEDATSRDLYNLYTEAAIQIFDKNLHSLLTDNFTPRDQTHTDSSYYSKSSIDFSKTEISTNQTAEAINRFVRAFTFREYQLPTYQGNPIVCANILDHETAAQLKINLDGDSVVIDSIDYPVQLRFDRLEKFLDACRRNNLHDVIKLRRNIVSVNDSNEKGWSPLMVAAYNNSYEIVKYLVAIGADVNACNFNGTNVLMYAKDGALKSRDRSTFDFLISAGADPHRGDYSGKSLHDYMSEAESIWITSH